MLSKAFHTQKNNLCGKINLSEKEYVVLLTPCDTHKFVDAAFFNKKKKSNPRKYLWKFYRPYFASENFVKG